MGYNAPASSAPRSVFPWCSQARSLVGPGVPGAPQPVATGRHWPRSTMLRILLREPHAGGVSGGSNGSLVSPVLWSRRSQGDSSGQPAPCDRWQGREGGSHRLDDNGKPHELVAVADPEQVHPHRHEATGVYWKML
jgi:hypothetical protein